MKACVKHKIGKPRFRPLKLRRLAVEYGIMQIDAKTKQCLQRALSEATQRQQVLVRETSDLERDILAIRRLLRNGPTSAAGQSQSDPKNGSIVGLICEALGAAQEIGGAGKASVAEVTRFLEHEGFSLKGDTPLRTYVGSELSRMARRTGSPVRRVGKGIYKYKG